MAGSRNGRRGPKALEKMDGIVSKMGREIMRASTKNDKALAGIIAGQVRAYRKGKRGDRIPFE
jgi:hypothetical protein